MPHVCGRGGLHGLWVAENAPAIARSGAFRNPIDMMYPVNATRSEHAGSALLALVRAGLVEPTQAREYARACLAHDAFVQRALEPR